MTECVFKDINKDVRAKVPRKQIIERDSNMCRKCGRMDGLEVHHIVAVSDGGTNEFSNLITLCSGCHTEWHSVEKVSILSMDVWLKYPPVHRIIIMLEKFANDEHKDLTVQDLLHIINLLTFNNFNKTEADRESIQSPVISAMARKKGQGQHCGSVPFGFEIVGKKLVKAEKEFRFITLIKQMKADGCTLQQIADELNAQNIKTKRGAEWQPTQVSRMLTRV